MPWSGLCRAAQQRSEQRRNVSEGTSRAQQKSINDCRQQVPSVNEDPSDCAEGCGEASGSRSSLASVGHKGRAFGSRETDIAQLIGGRQAGENSEGTRL